MRLIDVDKLIDYFKGQCKIAEEDSDPISEYVLAAFKCCIDLFEIFPTEDAEEVVRCKDCGYGGLCGAEIACNHPAYEQNEGVWGYDPEFFCAYGERRPE